MINYDKLKNLKQLKLYVILIVLILIFIGGIYLTYTYKIDKVINSVGIYSDEVLKIEINSELSDKIKNNNTLIFNGTKTKYQIKNYGEFNLVDNSL